MLTESRKSIKQSISKIDQQSLKMHSDIKELNGVLKQQQKEQKLKMNSFVKEIESDIKDIKKRKRRTERKN